MYAARSVITCVNICLDISVLRFFGHLIDT